MFKKVPNILNQVKVGGAQATFWALAYGELHKIPECKLPSGQKCRPS